jgi:hypothetical protein
MRVDVAKLLEAFRRAAWRWGVVHTDLVKHKINEDGSHTLSLHLERDDVVWEERRSSDAQVRLASTRPPPSRGGRTG